MYRKNGKVLQVTNLRKERMGKLPYIASAASAVIFGFSFLFTKTALDSLDMFQLLGMRFLVAALFMQFLKALKLIDVRITPEKIKSLLVVAALQPLLYFVFETIGVDLTTASESGVLIALIPVAVAVFAAPILKERLDVLQWVSILASVGGVVLISVPSFQGSSGHITGILALLGAVIAGALYNIFSRKASSTSTPVEVTYMMMWVGALVFNVIGVSKFAFQSNLPNYVLAFTSPDTLVAIFYLGIFSSVGAFFFMNYSLAHLTPSKSAVFINLTPVISVVAGVSLRGERFAPIQFIGAAIILGGVWGVNKRRVTSSLPGDS